VLQEVQEKNIIKVVPRDDFYYNSVISIETPQDHTVRAWDALGQDSIIIRLRVEQPSFEDEYEPEREEREVADSASPRSRRPLPSPSDPIVQALASALRSHQCSCARVHGVRTFEVCQTGLSIDELIAKHRLPLNILQYMRNHGALPLWAHEVVHQFPWAKQFSAMDYSLQEQSLSLEKSCQFASRPDLTIRRTFDVDA